VIPSFDNLLYHPNEVYTDYFTLSLNFSVGYYILSPKLRYRYASILWRLRYIYSDNEVIDKIIHKLCSFNL